MVRARIQCTIQQCRAFNRPGIKVNRYQIPCQAAQMLWLVSLRRNMKSEFKRGNSDQLGRLIPNQTQKDWKRLSPYRSRRISSPIMQTYLNPHWLCCSEQWPARYQALKVLLQVQNQLDRIRLDRLHLAKQVIFKWPPSHALFVTSHLRDFLRSRV